MRPVLLAIALLATTTAHAQYLQCFRDEAGVLHEVKTRMPETPPPTIPVPPPAAPPPPATQPPLTFNYTPQLHWRLICPNDVFYGPWTDVATCTTARGWVVRTCPKKRVDKTDGFSSLEQIRIFREGCSTDNGVSCHCQSEYH
jgi:hypothetical protein